MRKKIAPLLIMVFLLLSACKMDVEYTFMQPTDNIIGIDLLYVAPYEYFNPNDVEIVCSVNEDQWPELLEKFNQIDCKRTGMDPSYSLSGYILRISYTDGCCEVISAHTALRISADGDYRYTAFCFDIGKFEDFVKNVVAQNATQ